MSLKRKKILIAVIFVLLFIGFYLNRSYAHIFNYDESRTILAVDLIKEYTLENGKGSKSITYVAMGDSLTYGLGASNTISTYPYIIAENLLKKYKAVHVYNLGVVGAIAEDVEESQLPRAIELKPDFVTLMIGTNDFHNFVTKEDFKVSLEKTVDELQKNTDAEIILINIPFLGSDSLVLPPYNAIWENQIKEFNTVIAEVAESKKVKMIDLNTLSSKPFKQNQKKYYSIDEFHPSGEGYILWGNLINGN